MDASCSTFPRCTQGWTASASTRGSIEIIWSCVTVLILSSWSCICCHLPSPDDSHLGRTVRKLWLTIISILGPEFLLYIAVGQYLSAKMSVHAFREAGYSQWTMTHAFLADSGGWRLKTSTTLSIPLSSKSLLHLIKRNVIQQDQVRELVMVELSSITDRDKSDSFARTIALGQTIWFAFNIAARWKQDLYITTLELTVLGFLAPTVVTYFCWWHKPRDVQTAITITVDKPLPEVLVQTGLGAVGTWHRSPFDPIERQEFHGSLLYRYWLNILVNLTRSLPLVSQLTSDFYRKRSLARLRRSDNDIYPLYNYWRYGWLEVIPALPYLLINFAAWNYSFPTQSELVLWRGSAVAMTAAYILGAVIELSFLETWPRTIEQQVLQQHRTRIEPESRHSVITRLRSYLYSISQSLRNNSPSDDPELDIPLRLLCPATFLTLIYIFSRTWIILEDVISFRSLPISAYEVVDWTSFLPHIA